MKASFATKITSTERGTTDRLSYLWASMAPYDMRWVLEADGLTTWEQIERDSAGCLLPLSTRKIQEARREKTYTHISPLRAIASCTPLPLPRPSACPTRPPVRPCVPILAAAPPCALSWPIFPDLLYLASVYAL